DALQEHARACDMTVAAFATAWTLTREFLGSTLIGATTVAQLEETLTAANATIPADILAACDELSKKIMYPMG
ncbi:MAG: aldo/keto reductase, partial [Myxococcota bacterium]